MAARNAVVTVKLHATARVSQRVQVVVPYDDDVKSVQDISLQDVELKAINAMGDEWRFDDLDIDDVRDVDIHVDYSEEA